MSVLEVARVVVDPAQSQEFEAAFDEAIALVRTAEGHRGSRLARDLEKPGAYLFLVTWDDLSDHVDKFVGSAAFGEFENLIGPFLLEAPEVIHVEGNDAKEGGR